MDTLRQLIQTIAVIVILAVFLEMLLPRGDMRRYVKMVMGLLVIVAVLQAVTGAVNSNLLQEIPDVVIQSPSGRETASLEDIIAAGQFLAESNRQEAAQVYSDGIARQVMSLAELNENLAVTGARVQLEDNSGAIGRITIVCRPAAGEQPAPYPGAGVAPAVEPVIVGAPGGRPGAGAPADRGPTAAEREAAARTAEVVANFYNLRPEQVEIKFQ